MSTITITSNITDKGYLVSFSINSTGAPGDIPIDIFMYENTGENNLGEYQGVCTLLDYTKLQTFVGVPIPKFGNKFIKYSVGNIFIPFSYTVSNTLYTPEDLISKVTKDIKDFKTAYFASNNTTQIISI